MKRKESFDAFKHFAGGHIEMTNWPQTSLISQSV